MALLLESAAEVFAQELTLLARESIIDVPKKLRCPLKNRFELLLNVHKFSHLSRNGTKKESAADDGHSLFLRPLAAATSVV
jgi:hypothetical protein